MLRPERLNLAIAHRCFVRCSGCYQVFGRQRPDLELIETTVRDFVALGVTAVTLSGGDPLTIPGLTDFLTRLRALGVDDIKVDSVGTGLVVARTSRGGVRLEDLVRTVDWLGVPLDGWSNQSVGWFRSGRPRLFDETRLLLDALDALRAAPGVIVNSVAHRRNAPEFERIQDEVFRHSSVVQWNVFQYTPTDQASARANQEFALDDSLFDAVCQRLSSDSGSTSVVARSVRSRLGRYLLINADGTAWLPDDRGHTLMLGELADGAPALMRRWSTIARPLRAAAAAGADGAGRPLAA